MRLKKFNVEKEAKKLNRMHNRDYNIKKRTIVLSAFILVLSIMLFTYASFSATTKVNVMHANVGNLTQNDYAIVAYIDNVRTDTIPLKSAGYIVTNVTCDNGATGTWNSTDWTITVGNATVATTTCSVYFVTPAAASDANDIAEPELFDGWAGKAGLIPVKFNNGNTIVAEPDNEDEDWYDYEDHKWANAVLVSNYSDYFDEYGNLKDSTIGTTITESNILQYYVWIPRYRYKLFNTGSGTSTPEQMIEIKFEKNNRAKSEGDEDGEWLTHPAFTFGSTELNGFWVGKFEPSHSSTSTYVDQSTGNKLACSNDTCSAADGIIIKPNVVSMVHNNVANQFWVSRSIESSSTFNLKDDKLDTHMMKNMEWGAVAYLSASEYGLYNNATTCSNSANNKSVTINGSSVNRCEVWINNTHTGTGCGAGGDWSISACGGTITGCSAKNGISDGVQNSMTDCGGSQYVWNGTTNNGRSSTTGNVYGVYDMSGGAWEYVMGNQSNVSDTYNWNNYSAGFASAPDSKYYDKYLASALTVPSTSTSDNMEVVQRRDQRRGLLGDATREIMKTYGADGGGWFGDYAFFVSGPSPWFRRGGYAFDGANAGVFGFFRPAGGANADGSFRVVLSAQ